MREAGDEVGKDSRQQHEQDDNPAGDTERLLSNQPQQETSQCISSLWLAL